MSRPERDAFSVAGLPNTANYYMIDGIDNNDISINIAAAKPSIDSIREYKMQSGTYPPEFGHGGGAQINVITKSGSNAIHGTLYEFLRNSKRAETFNIANHPNFGSPATVWDSVTFGTLSSALDSRQTQFGLKLLF